MDFSKKDKLAEVKELLDKQKEKVKELEKAKKEAEESTKKIEELLQEAIEEEKSPRKKPEIKSASIRLQETTATIATSSKTEEETENVDYEEEKKKKIKPVYRITEQNPVVTEIYRQLNATYRQVASQSEPTLQSQAELYHELAALREQLRAATEASGVSQEQIAPRQRKNDTYSEEVNKNPNSRSAMFERLSQRVQAMAEQGKDQFDYLTRTETLITQIRNEFDEIIYQQNKK